MTRRVISYLIILTVFTALFTGCGAAVSDIKGIWYEETGYLGIIEFKEGGAASVIINDEPTDCTYTFDTSKGQGTLTFEDATSDITVKGDKLNIDGAVYTRKEVKQKDLDELINDVINASQSPEPTNTDEAE